MTYKYRWIYSEGYGNWYYINLPSDWTEDIVQEEMEYIENSLGPRYGCRWSNFQFERLTNDDYRTS